MIETFLWIGGVVLFLLSALLVGAWWAVADMAREAGGNPHDFSPSIRTVSSLERVGASYGCAPLEAQRLKTDESKFHVEQNRSKQPEESTLCQTR